MDISRSSRLIQLFLKQRQRRTTEHPLQFLIVVSMPCCARTVIDLPKSSAVEPHSGNASRLLIFLPFWNLPARGIINPRLMIFEPTGGIADAVGQDQPIHDHGFQY